eukprot:CAMPEP_0195520910 /NCGR_PEP_ID=MMETSP0794_2-20130614/17615_1 /TAXON_ID=515487 /ORGANISM="Stephanopyxis turris, Strain CCMP 815" /LENGTH=401 /DNA_ID=CAMNT_0040650353 /DNA_START=108 /DNA_END=1313 /DNA_ORIENTATION=-
MTSSINILSVLLISTCYSGCNAFVPHFTTTTKSVQRPISGAATSIVPNESAAAWGLKMSSSAPEAITGMGKLTDLPDSLDEAARIAAESTALFASQTGQLARCRVDFDTSVGDETYTKLKSSTEFTQKFVTALSYAMIPGLMDWSQKRMQQVMEAKVELRGMMEGGDVDEEEDGDSKVDEEAVELRKSELKELILNGGPTSTSTWDGPKLRIYFPDEGNAALANRDWKGANAQVPPCVEFSSLGGVQTADTSNDSIIIFFCPRASEAQFVEDTLYKAEDENPNLALTVFVNPILVDMGVTGFGMAGRMLRERLLDGLVQTYYLRTLQWGALARTWPRLFTVWQEDENEEGGYRLIKTLERQPSNPEVEDIYDIENGLMNEQKDGFGFLNALGDFVNGMTKL